MRATTLLRFRPLPLLATVLLAACATPPQRPASAPTTPTRPENLPTTGQAPAPVASKETPAAPRKDIWTRLRDSFRMNDCNADPSVQLWARRFTASPRRFEQRIGQSLPRLAFIQGIAESHDVAGEFVLLPWVESRYQPVHGHGRQPGGMWQIVPVTAGAMGLRVNRGFDGRMDVAAATEAVMGMLRRYQDQFQDWRLTDYAYNAGEFAVRKLVARHGAPSLEPAIPKLPVRNVTREHLVKLLAIACVVRHPEQFHVELPALAEDDHLVAVPIDHSMSMTKAASHAGMSVDALREYNAAFLNNRIDPELADSLLLPGSHVDEFQAAMRGADASDDTASRPLPDPGKTAPPRTHTVRAGESLWTIAKRYALSVAQLRRWNSLRGSVVHPGQILAISAPD